MRRKHTTSPTMALGAGRFRRGPSSFRGLVAGTVLRDYSAPSTSQEISKALTPGDAMAAFLKAVEEKPGASEGTKRKWRRQVQRRLS